MDISLKPVLPTIQKMIQDKLRLQAPVKTGTLKASVSVRATEGPDGLEVRTGFLKYGIFLDSGTGPYRLPSRTSPFNRNPGKGKGGIKPRYWTNLPQETTIRIAEIIEKSLQTQIDQQFKA